jgi:hypothetical protein
MLTIMRGILSSIALAVSVSFVCVGACGGSSGSPNASDGGGIAPDDGGGITLLVDGAPPHDAGVDSTSCPHPVDCGPCGIVCSGGCPPCAVQRDAGALPPCGPLTCGAAQFCVHTVGHFTDGATDQYSCQQIPSSCSASPTCACLENAAGGSTCGQCVLDNAGDSVTCVIP